MNSLGLVASALALGHLQLASDSWLHIPLGSAEFQSMQEVRALGACEVRLLSAGDCHAVLAVVARKTHYRNPAEADEAHAALLRLGAQTRWTDGFSGGLDEKGWECVEVTMGIPCHAAQVERTLERMLARLQSLSSTGPRAAAMPSVSAATGSSDLARGTAARPMFTWGLP